MRQANGEMIDVQGMLKEKNLNITPGDLERVQMEMSIERI
jgi:hypothetical protein